MAFSCFRPKDTASHFQPALPGYKRNTISDCLPSSGGGDLTSSAKPPINGNTIGNRVFNLCTPFVNEKPNDSTQLSDAFEGKSVDVGIKSFQHTDGTPGISCLVRSQSDSTCLSAKLCHPESLPQQQNLVGPIWLEDGRTRSGTPFADVPSASSSNSNRPAELADTSACGEASSIASRQSVDRLSDSRSNSISSGFSSYLLEALPPMRNELLGQHTQQQHQRCYQLVCRDGVQLYELVPTTTSSYYRDTDLSTLSRSTCATTNRDAGVSHPSINRPNAHSITGSRIHQSVTPIQPSPAAQHSRNPITQSTHHRVTSPTNHATGNAGRNVAPNSTSKNRPPPVAGHHPYRSNDGDFSKQPPHDKPTAPLPSRKQIASPPPTSYLMPSVHTRHTNIPTDEKRLPHHHTLPVDGMQGGGDWSSTDSSELPNPSSPRRSPRSFYAEQPSTKTPTHTRNSQSNVCGRQATIVNAPTSTAVQLSRAETIVTDVSRQPAGNQPRPRTPTTMHSSSRMTVSELRSVAERQRQQLCKQAQQLQIKEERRALLRSVRMRGQRNDADQLPLPGTELTEEQEVRLHKLRGYRGQTERVRLTNENLVTELGKLTHMLSSKELELQVCRQRAEEAKRILSVISACQSFLSNTTGSRSQRPSATPHSKTRSGTDSGFDKPLDLLAVELPFESDRTKKHWNEGLLEADRLDRQISMALSHNAAIQSKRAASRTSESDQSSEKTHRHRTDAKLVPSPPTAPTGAQPTPQTSSSPQHTTSTVKHTSFSSVLSRASSPPTNRRSSLRMFLQVGNNTSSSGDNVTNSTDSAQAGLNSLRRMKVPLRYAPRDVINDTYMRRICKDSMEKYKRTANEVYRANVERLRLNTDSTPPVSIDSGKSATHSPSLTDQVSFSDLEPGEVQLKDSSHLDDKKPRVPTPTDSISSSTSSSSLEIVGSEHSSLNVVKKPTLPELSPVDEEVKHSVGDMDSGLGGSDDTGNSEQPVSTSMGVVNSATTIVYVNEIPKTDTHPNIECANTIGGLTVKPILRRIPKQKLSADKSNHDPSEFNSDRLPSSTSSRSNSVRFHPLALLLDAAFVGDLQLVKKVANEVSDVSKPNDEGITALHNAVCAGHTDVVEFLVRTAGADVNAGDTDGWTPLHCAASCANLPFARLLVEHGASLHARTLSDQETPLEKCYQGDDDAECEEYLFFQQERLGSSASGRVYAIFPRGLEAAGPGSADAHLEADELAVYPNEPLTIIDRKPNGETEWMLAEKVDQTRGLIPSSHISCYPLVRVPPASHPVPLPPPHPKRVLCWDEANGEEAEDDDEDEDTNEVVKADEIVEVDVSHSSDSEEKSQSILLNHHAVDTQDDQVEGAELETIRDLQTAL